jgi:hypothetical protein
MADLAMFDFFNLGYIIIFYYSSSAAVARLVHRPQYASCHEISIGFTITFATFFTKPRL